MDALRRASIGMLLAAAPFGTAFAQVGAGRGFLLGAPDGSLTLRGGWAVASAGSDIFSFTTDNLTLNRRDFSSPTVGADLAFRALSRTDVVVSVEYDGMSKQSEFRHFIDNNHLPIQQSTAFHRLPVTLSVKQYLTTRGRSIGRFAWIPSRFSAYVGAGGGVQWYRFKQVGDWIDFQTNDVFPATLQSDGWAPMAHMLVGGEWSLSARFAAVTEARYTWSHASLGTDFTGFAPIDLSGLSTTAGIAIRY
jgi:hypothetical protein